MAVEKPMEPSDILETSEESLSPDLTVVVEDPEAVEVEMDDGSVVIEFGDTPEMDEDVSHDSNLAEYIEDDELEEIANELIEHFSSDRESRGEWASAYIKGIDLLGMKVE